MTSSLYFLLILLVLFGIGAGLTRQYFAIDNYMSWNAAQAYCRSNYRDLATITSEVENQRLLTKVGNLVAVWIGLKRNTYDSNPWQWSDGEPLSFFNRNLDPTSFLLNEDCVRLDGSGWSSDNCQLSYPFICYKTLILVNENKTWDDALSYCRMHYTDLAIPGSVTNPGLIEEEAAQSHTLSVWMGLQFLDGKWFWLNKAQKTIPDSLPPCPIQNYQCGSRNIETHIWENRDCNEKLNFLCYWGWKRSVIYTSVETQSFSLVFWNLMMQWNLICWPDFYFLSEQRLSNVAQHPSRRICVRHKKPIHSYCRYLERLASFIHI